MMTHYLVRRSHRVEEETLGTKVHTLCRAGGARGAGWAIDSPPQVGGRITSRICPIKKLFITSYPIYF